jgi:putative tricarboxylic transport membrane protein
VLAEVALRFSSFEYFWLACLGLTCAVFIASNDPVKGLVSLLIGLLIATIGLDPVAGPALHLRRRRLMGGISFIPR